MPSVMVAAANPEPPQGPKAPLGLFLFGSFLYRLTFLSFGSARLVATRPTIQLDPCILFQAQGRMTLGN